MTPVSVIIVIALVIPVFFILMWVVSSYNRLVSLRNRFKNAYAQIDVQLKRRYDLIPNLVETAKGEFPFAYLEPVETPEHVEKALLLGEPSGFVDGWRWALVGKAMIVVSPQQLIRAGQDCSEPVPRYLGQTEIAQDIIEIASVDKIRDAAHSPESFKKGGK